MSGRRMLQKDSKRVRERGKLLRIDSKPDDIAAKRTLCGLEEDDGSRGKRGGKKVWYNGGKLNCPGGRVWW
ncbi:hypothetical protein TNIN_458031 [Trichonephila inaurata madagascariensis]|uniref:Uncharacterized protein n=1 Tax=Trichonephila inaurata madagascariensis TaxID=2747483 RepID=A0A8X6XHH6_9ARAC|nr:hypothetical protein TNIN_458031 [Trichonephila inaurata madagascariensis]